MKYVIATIVSAGLVHAASAGIDPPVPGTIDLRIVTTDLQPSLTVDTTGLAGPIELEFYLQATVIGDPDATGVGVFEALLADSDGSGAFGKAALTIEEATGLPFPGLDLMGRTGMFPDYRGAIGGNNDDPGNGELNVDGKWVIVPISLSDPNDLQIPTPIDPPNLNWVNVYKLLYTTSDLSDRTVTINAEGTSGAYFVQGDFRQPAPANDAPGFNVTFVPAPATVALTAAGAGMIGLRRRR